MKILFVLRKRNLQYGEDRIYCLRSSGLRNSATFVHEMLLEAGHDSKLVEVDDANRIDREVYLFRPEICIIEAYWAPPKKLAELQRLHPTVRWVVRCHSELPFLQNEGIAIDWTYEYLRLANVYVAFNSKQTFAEVNRILPQELQRHALYLPNYYPVPPSPTRPDRKPRGQERFLDIGCFGAVRPQKNHLPQAVAAITYANAVGKVLRFHINGTRVEGRGDAVIKNLRALFRDNPTHQLIEHEWLDHEAFMALIESMDVCMQVSFTESFNIVTADAVVQSIPVVVSDQIDWVEDYFWADPTSVDSMVDVLKRTMYWRKWVGWWDVNFRNLTKYSLASRRTWLEWLKKLPEPPKPPVVPPKPGNSGNGNGNNGNPKNPKNPKK